jgi:hypothetical protein
LANILTHAVQSNFLSGVLDPRTQGRVDTSAYVTALLQGVNIELSHMGGVSRRRGHTYRMTMPNVLTQLTGTYTVPEGGEAYISPAGNGVYYTSGAPGTPTLALGSNKWGIYLTATTVNAGTINPYVIAQVDLGSAQTVQFADVVCFSLTGGSTTHAVIQSSPDNSTWTTCLAMPQVDAENSTAGYSYRFTGPVTARYWRVAIIGGSNLGTALAQLGDFTLWGTTSTVSNGRLIPFEVSAGEQYALVVTDHSGSVVNANTGALLQNIPLPYASADVPLVDAQSSAETLALAHSSYQPMFLIRQNSPLVLPTSLPNYASYYNFQPYPVIFDAIPQVYFADSLSPTGAADVQTLTFNSGWNVGDTFTITLLTDTTGPIIYSGDNNTTAYAIQVAVQALWAVNGYTGVSCVSNGSYTYTLTFAFAAAEDVGAIAITSLSSNATATAAETSIGSSAQENLWSPVRGYPACVCFFQGRLYYGGFQSQQESLVGSWVNNILNFSTEQGLDDQAIYVTMSGVALNAITGLFPAKSLCVMTTGGEFRFVNDQNQPIVPTSAPQNQTQYGTAQIKPVMIDGNVVFVQRTLKTIRDFQFDYTVDQYNSLGVSTLVPNLIYSVKDLASWQGALNDELNYVFVVNGVNPSTDFDALPNGSMSVYNTRKEVNVQAWVNWQTPGASGTDTYQAVCGVVANILILTQRTINGVSSLILEQPVQGTYTDCNYVNTVLNASQVTGLTWLANTPVRALGDGYVLDTNTVSSTGVLQLTSDGQPYTATSVEVGLNFNPLVQPMPLQTVRWPAGSNLAHKKRIQAIRLKVRETQGLQMYTEGGPDGQTINIIPQMAQLDNFQMDNGPLPLYTGLIEVEASSVWDQTEDKTVTYTQVDPLPMNILYQDVTLSGEQ